jgi:hypothetical protein
MKYANIFYLLIFCSVLLPAHSSHGNNAIDDEQFFTLKNGLNLRTFGGSEVRQLLFRKHGSGMAFKAKQQNEYCKLKKNKQIQWSVSDLQSGKLLSASSNADELFFGASASKVFVAAALLDKQNGSLEKEQLRLMSRMIVRSDNGAWRELQRQAGKDGSDNSGRKAVHEFSQKMGYEDICSFQGWMTKKDGSRLHGNELHCLSIAKFLFDTYHDRYPGAEILWKIMHATRTGRKKINKYTPKNVFIGGKTGTYHGPNESKTTIKHDTIKARNHITILDIDGKYYSLTVLSNTGKDEDVAVLGGGLMREYLGVKSAVSCSE